MVMFGGSFGDDIYGDKGDSWGVLQDHYQGGKKDTTGFELDTSGIGPTRNLYSDTGVLWPQPVATAGAENYTDSTEVATDPVGGLSPQSWGADISPNQYEVNDTGFQDFLDKIGEAGFDPNKVGDQQYQALLSMMQQYGLSAQDFDTLAQQYTDNEYIDQLQGLIDTNDFDADQFRQSQQSAIQQGSQDLAQQTIGQLIASGQLNSSAGQNYMAGSQAKYLTSTMAQLERDIVAEEDKRAVQEGSWLTTINNMNDADKKSYADMVSKSLGLRIEGTQKFFDGLTSMLNNEITWDTFLANYTTPDNVGGGLTWNDYDITAADFSEVGTAIENVFHDTYGLPWNEQIDQGNGYSVMKSAVGDNNFKLTYYNNGQKLFDYTFDKNDDYGDVARALWGKFDDGMKDNWGAEFKWEGGGEVDPDIVDPDPDPVVPQTGYWDTEGFALSDAQRTQVGADIPLLWESLPDDGSWKTINYGGKSVQAQKFLWRNQPTNTYGYQHQVDSLIFKDPETGEERPFQYSSKVVEYPAYQGSSFFQKFKDIFGDYWNGKYSWGY